MDVVEQHGHCQHLGTVHELSLIVLHPIPPIPVDHPQCTVRVTICGATLGKIPVEPFKHTLGSRAKRLYRVHESKRRVELIVCIRGDLCLCRVTAQYKRTETETIRL